jgi:hypothetical protein
MNSRTIRAHFDGEQIHLDEPCQLEPDTKLLVIVLPPQPRSEESDEWLRLSQQALERAYSAYEPDYSLEAIKEPNPDYEGR